MYGVPEVRGLRMETCYIPKGRLGRDDLTGACVDDDGSRPRPLPLVVHLEERDDPDGLRGDALLEEAHLVAVGDEVDRLPGDRHRLVL